MRTRQMAQAICKQCGKEFIGRADEIKSGERKFCSVACFRLSHRRRATLTCPICSREFETIQHKVRNGIAKYCSMKCLWDAKIREVERRCEQCQATFKINPSVLKKAGSGKFCSRRCHTINKTTDPIKRFLSRVQVLPGPNSCWLWTGWADRDGYGRLHRKDKSRRANIISYEYFRGPISQGIEICHTCDNPTCVNPEHLFEGTRFDNYLDSLHKNRRPGVILNEETVAKIIAELNNWTRKSAKILANKYGTRESLIRHIKTGRTWKHIPRPTSHSQSPTA